MSEFVTLRHQKLPSEQTIRIHRDRIGVRLAAGWEMVESEPSPEPVTEPEKPKRQRRTNTSEEQ